MKFLKIITKIIAWAAVAVILLVVVLLGVNAFDEKLDEGIAAFSGISVANVKDEENAYYSSLMLYVPANEDPHARGVQTVKDINAALLADPSRLDKKFDDAVNVHALDVKGAEILKFDSKGHLFGYGAHLKEIPAVLSANGVLLERYGSLYAYPYFRETVRPSLFSPILNIHKVHEIQLARIVLLFKSGKTNEALRLLRQDTAFWRRVIEGAGSLGAKLMAIRRVEWNVRLLSDILREVKPGSDGVKTAYEILKPLTAAERSYNLPLRRWFITGMYLFESKRLFDENEFGLPGYILRPFFKKHATTNMIYRYEKVRAELVDLPAKEFAARLKQGRVPSMTKKPDSITWDFIYNPAGKILIGVAGVNYVEFARFEHNLDGLMRLVTLELMLKQRPAKDGVEKFIKEAGPQYSNPYTGEPMQWDASKRIIFFNGMGYDAAYNELISVGI